MTSHILDKLKDENDNEIREFGRGFFITPENSESLNAFSLKAQHELKSRLSDDYLELLKYTDGFSINGFNLYSSSEKSENFYLSGIIEANIAFWEEESLRGYIAYADENSSRLVFNLKTNKFECVDNVTWEIIEEFDSFYKTLAFMLEESCIFSS